MRWPSPAWFSDVTASSSPSPTASGSSARTVVVAIGVEHFAYVPAPLSDLPASACTHSSAHTDLAAFRGQEVVVVGAGQSALESAALLHENGAKVQVLARRRVIAWNGPPLDPDRPLLRRLREPEAGLGSGWSTWFYSDHPDLFRRLPPRTRVYRARTALGPAGACWLRERVEGQFPVRTGHTVTSATALDGKVRLSVAGAGTAVSELTVDHVIAATGYRINLEAAGVPAGCHAVLAAYRGRQRGGRAPTTSPRFPGSTSSGRPSPPAWGRSCGSSSVPSTPPQRSDVTWPPPPAAGLHRRWLRAGNG